MGLINMNEMYFDSDKFIREMEEHEGVWESPLDYDEYEEEKMNERDLRGGL